jgi:hypothetical protein
LTHRTIGPIKDHQQTGDTAMTDQYKPALEVPAYLYDWMRTQSHSAFIAGMMIAIERNGGLNEDQIIQVKIKYIQAGNNIPR